MSILDRVLDTGGDLLESIVDAGGQFVTGLAGIEYEKRLAEGLADIRESEERGRTEQTAVHAGIIDPSVTGLNQNILTAGAIIGGVMMVAAVFLIAKG